MECCCPPVEAATAAPLPAYVRTGNTLDAVGAVALPQIDGITVPQGKSFWLQNGAAEADNGVWVVENPNAPFKLTRHSCMQVVSQFVSGKSTFVLDGDTFAGEYLVLDVPSPYVLNVSPVRTAGVACKLACNVGFLGTGTFLIGFDTVFWDTRDAFDGASTFTVPKTGKYRISVNFGVDVLKDDDDPHDVIIYLRRNTVAIRNMEWSDRSSVGGPLGQDYINSMCTTDEYQLDEGDTIDVQLVSTRDVTLAESFLIIRRMLW